MAARMTASEALPLTLVRDTDLEHTPRGTCRLRLTRRGRLVFGALAALVIAGVLVSVASFAGAAAQASDVATSSQQFHYVVVQPGETLWGVATELDPGSDPRDLVAEIVRLNQLEGSGVQAGQPLAVPLRYSDSAVVISAEELYGTAA